MKTSENHFWYIHYLKRAMFFNRLNKVLKTIRLWSPILIFLWFIIHSYFIVFGIIVFTALFSWLGEVKTSSLRNINYYASKEFKKLDLKEKYGH